MLKWSKEHVTQELTPAHDELSRLSTLFGSPRRPPLGINTRLFEYFRHQNYRQMSHIIL